MKEEETRPSVNYAKDWLDQLFLFPGLVWYGKWLMAAQERRIIGLASLLHS